MTWYHIISSSYFKFRTWQFRLRQWRLRLPKVFNVSPFVISSCSNCNVISKLFVCNLIFSRFSWTEIIYWYQLLMKWFLLESPLQIQIGSSNSIFLFLYWCLTFFFITIKLIRHMKMNNNGCIFLWTRHHFKCE